MEFHFVIKDIEYGIAYPDDSMFMHAAYDVLRKMYELDAPIEELAITDATAAGLIAQVELLHRENQKRLSEELLDIIQVGLVLSTHDRSLWMNRLYLAYKAHLGKPLHEQEPVFRIFRDMINDLYAYHLEKIDAIFPGTYHKQSLFAAVIEKLFER